MDLIIFALCLSMFSKQSSMAQDAGRIERENQNTIQTMQEYRKWNAWDNNLVYAPDVVSAILEFRGDPEIWIVPPKDGDKNEPDDNNPIKVYTESNTRESDLVDIHTKFADSTQQYVSKIYRDDEHNQEVSRIYFIKQ